MVDTTLHFQFHFPKYCSPHLHHSAYPPLVHQPRRISFPISNLPINPYALKPTSIIKTIKKETQHNLISFFIVEMFAETHQTSKDITYPSQVKNQKALKLVTPEPLNESENHLKRILIKSQLFLNTAEALFKLNIPFVVLHAGSQDYHDEESKLVLDCGYEIMKRKGKKQELSVHPFMKISVTSIKVKSLDTLVKLLYKDLEKLKLYCRNGNAECLTPVEDYLPKMLECDVYNWDIDVNCMWDCGWDKMMFAFLEKDDVIRDVEKFVLDGLLDEVAKDLLPVF